MEIGLIQTITELLSEHASPECANTSSKAMKNFTSILETISTTPELSSCLETSELVSCLIQVAKQTRIDPALEEPHITSVSLLAEIITTNPAALPASVMNDSSLVLLVTQVINDTEESPERLIKFPSLCDAVWCVLGSTAIFCLQKDEEHIVKSLLCATSQIVHFASFTKTKNPEAIPNVGRTLTVLLSLATHSNCTKEASAIEDCLKSL